MKFLSILLLLAVAAIAGRTTTASNGHNVYVTKTEANVKLTIPANATNITPAI